MTDTTAAGPETGAAPAPIEIPIPAHVAGGEGPMTAREAARSITDWRRKGSGTTTNSADTAAEPAPAAQESEAAQAGEDAAQQETAAPGETQEAETVAEAQPAIEPPRSWTKEAKERWDSLPRETQEYLSSRETEREREFRRSQNETAESRKAIEAERQTVAQAKQQYEAALPALLQTIQSQQAGEFSDIKSMADVERLAREDWPRFSIWQAHQMKIDALQRETQAVQQRQSEERQTQWSEFTKRQDELFLEKASEMSDKAVASKLQSAAVDVLKEVGFTDDELGKLWNGQASVSLRDHRVQLLIRDGVRYREAQQKAKAAVAKPVPQVQRPGVAQGANASREAHIQSLETRLSQTGSAKDAAALLRARRAAR